MLDPYGYNIIGSPSLEFLETIRRQHSALHLLMDLGADDIRAIRAASPGAHLSYRIWTDEGQWSDRIRRDPHEAASAAHNIILNRQGQLIDVFDQIDSWQICNEILQVDPADYAKYVAFEVDRMILAELSGYRCAILAHSEGNPDLPVQNRMFFWGIAHPALKRAAVKGHVVAMHQYGWPDLWGGPQGGAPWHINRLETQVLPNLPPDLRSLKFIVSEYGVDRLMEPHAPAGGWQTSPVYRDKPKLYAAHLDDMATWLLGRPQHNQIIGYALYCAFNNGDHNWQSYRHDGELAEILATNAEHRRARNGGTPVPAPQPIPAPNPTPAPIPAAPTVIDLIEAVRRTAWDRLEPILGIPYVPEHAYPQLARARLLGAPITLEFDVRNKEGTIIAQGQGYAGGILANLPGQWADQHVKTISW